MKTNFQKHIRENNTRLSSKKAVRKQSLKEIATNESDRTDLNRVMQGTRSNASNSESVPEDIKKKVTQKWKRGTVPITGYSVLTGIDEKKLQQETVCN